jgi:hypothetical protein
MQFQGNREALVEVHPIKLAKAALQILLEGRRASRGLSQSLESKINEVIVAIAFNQHPHVVGW